MRFYLVLFWLLTPQVFASELNFYSDQDSNRPILRHVLNPKYGTPASYEITYLSESASDRSIHELKIYDLKGQLQKTHSTQHVFQPSVDVKSPKVLVIDSGFLTDHPLLTSKIHSTITGILGGGGSVSYFHNHSERLKMPPTNQGAPFSHGSFVASVAMRGVDHASFIGAAGDIFAAGFLYKMIEVINQYDLKFTNLSFGFGDRETASVIDKDDHWALDNFIRFQPSVLHVVASGNHGINFDESSYSEYPACIRSRNLITVGALAADEIREGQLSQVERSQGSNHGVRCVDVMAPGENVVGAALWPKTMRASGTSVASPLVLNTLLKMDQINSQLSPFESREILLKTVYVPKNKVFHVRSAGILHPRRALMATKLYKKGLSIDQAVIRAREILNDSQEINDFTKLSEIWEKNKLRF